MLNAKVKEVWETSINNDDTWEGQVAFLQTFAQQIVGETVLAILATDLKDVIYTTYDQDRVHGIVARVVDSVRNHWDFK